MKQKLFILSVALLPFSFLSAQMPDTIREHLSKSLGILKEHSLYAKKVNWTSLENQVYEAASNAKSKEETFDALKIAYEALGDKHAAYYQFSDSYRIDNAELISRYSEQMKLAWKNGVSLKGEMIADYAYLLVPYMGVTKQEDIDKMANSLYNKVVELHKQNPKGWIIDLRLNSGGNIRPMMAGLELFFQDGIISRYVDKDGTTTDVSAFVKGHFLMNGAVQAAIKHKQSFRITGKVAVLMGPGTASSAEAVATAFQQRKKSKLFGENSAGLANSTEGFVFNDNNSYYLLSTSRITDGMGKILPEVVRPDVYVTRNDAFNDLPNDNVVKAAIDWLQK